MGVVGCLVFCAEDASNTKQVSEWRGWVGVMFCFLLASLLSLGGGVVSLLACFLWRVGGSDILFSCSLAFHSYFSFSTLILILLLLSLVAIKFGHGPQFLGFSCFFRDNILLGLELDVNSILVCISSNRIYKIELCGILNS